MSSLNFFITICLVITIILYVGTEINERKEKKKKKSYHNF